MIRKIALGIILAAYVLKTMVTDIPHGLWHTIRCEAVGRSWEWTTYTAEIGDREHELYHCSCCGYERRVLPAYL
jgi:hypothetical protein